MLLPQRVPGRLAISPDEGDLCLGRRLLALGDSGKTRLDYVAVENYNKYIRTKRLDLFPVFLIGMN